MEISKEDALFMIQKYHYSNTLPKLNKCFVGFYLDNRLVGVVTLGWGTRPRHTIKRIFPSLDTKDYFEIGRMKKFNIQHFKGKQYRYLTFLCDKKEKKRLLSECLIDLNLPRPKDDDLSWKVKDVDTEKWIVTTKPYYTTDIDQTTKNKVVIM